MGIHSGGMVICDRPVAEIVPVEWARMENRTVVQYPAGVLERHRSAAFAGPLGNLDSQPQQNRPGRAWHQATG
jgi:hypothetical protein